MTVEQQSGTASTVQLAFRPTREEIGDVTRIRRRVTRSGRRGRVMRTVALVLLLVAAALYAANGMVPDLVFLLVFAGAVWVLGWLMRRLMVRQVHKLKTSRGEHRITVGPEGVHVATDLNTMRVPWSQLSGYAETERLFLLLHTGPNDINTTPLPKSGVAQPADIDRLRELLDRHTIRTGSIPRP